MPYIPCNHDFFDHSQTRALARTLRCSQDKVIAGLLRFWVHCLTYIPDGDLRSRLPEDVAHAFHYPPPQAERLVNAMIETGWLEVVPYFRVHNWWTHAGPYLQSRFRRTPGVWKRIRELYGEAPPKALGPEYLTEEIELFEKECPVTVNGLSDDSQWTVISHQKQKELIETELNRLLSLREKRGGLWSTRTDRAGEEFLRRVKGVRWGKEAQHDKS